MKSVTPKEFKESPRINEHWTKLDYEISHEWYFVEYALGIAEDEISWCKQQESPGRFMAQPKGIFFEDSRDAVHFKLKFSNK